MAEFVHPNLNDVPLSAVLYALADPARLEILKNLAKAGELSCEAALPCNDIAKSTRSNHFKVLRSAGIIETRKAGRCYISSLRKTDLDMRFPGLLTSILGSID